MIGLADRFDLFASHQKLQHIHCMEQASLRQSCRDAYNKRLRRVTTKIDGPSLQTVLHC